MTRLASLTLALCLAAPAFAQTDSESEVKTEPAAEEPAIALPELGPAVFLAIDGTQAWRVSDWLDAPVRLAGGDDEIGEVEDLMIGADGQTIAAILEVGGFLGMGEKSIAVDINSLRANVDDDGDLVLELQATREQIDQAQPVLIDD